MIALFMWSVEEVLAAILIVSAPNTFQVVRVPVPTVLNETSSIPYTVSVSAPASLIGPASGVVRSAPAGASGTGRRYVLLSLRFVANAAAGETVVARVTFGTTENPRVVPIIANILPSRRVSLTSDAAMRAARHGEQVTMHYILENDGNAPDTLELNFSPPQGWALKSDPSPVILMPGASAIRTVALRVPRTGASGDFIVGAAARAHDGERARTTSTVSILEESAADIRDGPTLTTAISSVAGGGTPVRSVLSAEVSGRVSEEVRLDARFAPSNTNDPAVARSLLEVGTYQTPFFAALVAPTWQIGLGTTGQALSDLTGVSASGQGISLQGRRGNGILAVLATSTSLGGTTSSGTSSGTSSAARYQFMSEHATTSVTAVHITSGAGDFGRELNAFGVGIFDQDRAGGVLTSDLAFRQYRGGSGVGWNLHARRDGDALSYDLQVIHAPGGSAAFAAAADGLSGTVARRISDRVRMFANGWQSSDNNPAFGDLATHGWSVSPQTHIAGTTYLDLAVHGSSFETTQTPAFGEPARGALAPLQAQATTIPPASSDRMGFGTKETGLSATLRTAHGGMYSSAQIAFDRVDRTTDILSRHFEEYSPRTTLQATVGVTRDNGVVELNLNDDVAGGSSGNASSLLSVRAEHIVLPHAPAWLFFNGEIQRIKSSERAPALMSQRLGLETLLGEAYSVHFDAERNPYYMTAQGRAAVLFSMKIERSIRMPRLRRGGVSGYVFQDLNGNGVRDAAEPGLGNIAVYGGGEKSVTAEDGSYRLFSGSAAHPTVDVRSLPFGWTLESDAANSRADTDIPVIPHTSARVTLMVVADALGHIPHVEWSKVDVFGRDERGREWLARPTGTNIYIFDALPPGEYILRVNAVELDEPLAVQGQPKLTLGGRGTGGRMTLLLYPRPVRMWRRAAPAAPAAGGQDTLGRAPIIESNR